MVMATVAMVAVEVQWDGDGDDGGDGGGDYVGDSDGDDGGDGAADGCGSGHCGAGVPLEVLVRVVVVW